MDHLAASLEIPEPWRTRALVATAIAAVELFLLLTVALAVLSRPITERVTTAVEQRAALPTKPAKPERKKKPAPAVPELERGETAVLVLNGNGVSGAAAAQAEHVRALGYLIGGVGNAPSNDFTRSLVMYRPGFKPEARRLAREIGIPLVSPLDGLTRKDLMGAHLAVVVGA